MKGKAFLDLTVPDNDGYVWDFNRKRCRDRALQIVNEKRPLFLMMSPECTPYSTIQNLIMRTPAGRAKVELARRRGDVHLKFSMTLARRQMDGGRSFIYEHPKLAASWDNPDVDGLASTEGVMRTELGQCGFGLTSKDELGEAPAKKPTLLLRNSVAVHRTMGVKCRGGIVMCT